MSEQPGNTATSCRRRRVRIQVPTADWIQITTLRFDIPDAEPILGDPQRLQGNWQKKQGLKINNQGEIVPLYP